MIEITARGSFKKTEDFLLAMQKADLFASLERYGQMGVNALNQTTPRESGETAAAWYYEVVRKNHTYSIVWRNSHVVDGVNIAVILQYGHATGSGGYVQGRDYINPALLPLFDQIADDVWKAVKSA